MRLIDADDLWYEVIHSMGYCYDILKIIDEQKTVGPDVYTWVPCSKRMPDECGTYLVTLVPDADSLYARVDIARYSKMMGTKEEPVFWIAGIDNCDAKEVTDRVVAWAYLPLCFG